ncbi:hypothetical protein LTR81_027594 [Elasticomyces elasticus]
MSRDRLHYTLQQLHTVYDRINLPTRYRYEPGDFSREVAKHHDGNGFLGALVTHTLAHIPFENLSLHNSPTHAVSIHPDALFQKIIWADMGRGGYCLENNVFLGTVLRSLGFDVTSVGARINRMGKGGVGNEDRMTCFGGWTHMINLVTMRDEVFVVDVRFGPGGPARPLKLIDGKIEVNLVATPHKFIPTDEDEATIVGEIILYEHKVTRRLNGTTETLATLSTETERIEALFAYIGLRLSQAQAAGIKGMATELKSGDGQQIPYDLVQADIKQEARG